MHYVIDSAALLKSKKKKPIKDALEVGKVECEPGLLLHSHVRHRGKAIHRLSFEGRLNEYIPVEEM